MWDARWPDSIISISPHLSFFFCYATRIERLPSKMQRLSIILVEKKETSHFRTKKTMVAGPDFYIVPRWRLRCKQAAPKGKVPSIYLI
jgi:hypothetical protein